MGTPRDFLEQGDSAAGALAAPPMGDLAMARPSTGRRRIVEARPSRTPVAVVSGVPSTIPERQRLRARFSRSGIAPRRADEVARLFVKQNGGNKVGQQIVDERETLVSD